MEAVLIFYIIAFSLLFFGKMLLDFQQKRYERHNKKLTEIEARETLEFNHMKEQMLAELRRLELILEASKAGRMQGINLSVSRKFFLIEGIFSRQV